MEFRTYTTIKSPEQPFIHVHFIIGENHHIVEINDANANFSILRKENLECVILNDIIPGAFAFGDVNEFKIYTFKADKEGFQLVKDMNTDIIVSGNITGCTDKFSKFTLEINDENNVWVLIIRTTFNNQQVESIIPIDTQEKRIKAVNDVYSMIRTLYKSFSIWKDNCTEDEDFGLLD
jgi:hypothetical protein